MLAFLREKYYLKYQKDNVSDEQGCSNRLGMPFFSLYGTVLTDAYICCMSEKEVAYIDVNKSFLG